MKKALLSILLAAMLLALPACRGDGISDTAPPVSFHDNASENIEDTYIPRLFIHYEDEAYDSHAQLTALRVGELEIVRPHGSEQLCTVILADTGGEVRLAILEEAMPAVEGAEFYAAERLTGMTLTAHPIDQNGVTNTAPEAAQTITISNGRFSLPVGKHYFELTLPRESGTLVYGFIAHRIDAEEYRVTEHISGCLVEVEYENPDHQAKQLPTVHLRTPIGREGALHGMMLSPCGEITQTYLNASGTQITRRIDLGDPLNENRMHTIHTSQLLCEYEIEWAPDKTVTAAHYDRYSESGALLDGGTLVAAGAPRVDSLTLQPHSLYVFSVQYADTSAKYVLRTGMSLDEITPHPMDDPECDPELAKLLRATHVNWYHTSDETVASVNVYIRNYLGRFGDMEAVMFAEDGKCTDQGAILLYHTHQFYTLSDAKRSAWITEEEIDSLLRGLNR